MIIIELHPIENVILIHWIRISRKSQLTFNGVTNTKQNLYQLLLLWNDLILILRLVLSKQRFQISPHNIIDFYQTGIYYSDQILIRIVDSLLIHSVLNQLDVIKELFFVKLKVINEFGMKRAVQNWIENIVIHLINIFFLQNQVQITKIQNLRFLNQQYTTLKELISQIWTYSLFQYFLYLFYCVDDKMNFVPFMHVSVFYVSCSYVFL